MVELCHTDLAVVQRAAQALGLPRHQNSDRKRIYPPADVLLLAAYLTGRPGLTIEDYYLCARRAEALVRRR